MKVSEYETGITIWQRRYQKVKHLDAGTLCYKVPVCHTLIVLDHIFMVHSIFYHVNPSLIMNNRITIFGTSGFL